MYTWQNFLAHLLLYTSGTLNILWFLNIPPMVQNQPKQQLCASLQYMDANAYLQRTAMQILMCAESYEGLQMAVHI
jgi:hypothetical protein